ncbi:hypothetical protein R6Z07F_013136 [Ovis aries]
MTWAGALLLLCAALLLITGGKCDDICPALRDTVDLFISGSHEAYIEQVEKYNQNPDVLETANTLKSCVDEKLTPQDKQDALSALDLDGDDLPPPPYWMMKRPPPSAPPGPEAALMPNPGPSEVPAAAAALLPALPET